MRLMAPKRSSGSRARPKSISKEIRAVFDEATQPPPVPPGRRRRDTPMRYRPSVPPDPGPEHLPAPRAVPEHLQWAARLLREQLEGIAAGRANAPARGVRRPRPAARPYEVERVQPVLPDGSLAAGGRSVHDADEKALRAAYRAWVGVEVEATWEVALADELRAEQLFEFGFRLFYAGEGELVLEDGKVPFVVPPRRTPEQILRAVEKNSPPGTVPSELTPDVIEVACENTTDARGGGRGKETKLSIEGFIEKFKKNALANNPRAARKRKKK